MYFSTRLETGRYVRLKRNLTLPQTHTKNVAERIQCKGKMDSTECKTGRKMNSMECIGGGKTEENGRW